MNLASLSLDTTSSYPHPPRGGRSSEPDATVWAKDVVLKPSGALTFPPPDAQALLYRCVNGVSLASARMEIIRTPRGEMPTYVATPAGDGPWPGVVVIHDFTGMSHDLRNQADWLAEHGFIAAAPDLYYWGTRLGCLWTIMRDIGAGQGRTFDDIDAARTWLIQQDICTGKVGVIGFCMGGGYALALAPTHDYAVASVNYGGCPKDAEQALAETCPIVGSYGKKDGSPMGWRAAERLERALTTLGVDHDVKIYPDAGHGFINDHDPADMTPLLRFLGAVSRTSYHEPSARDARDRIASFFHSKLDA